METSYKQQLSVLEEMQSAGFNVCDCGNCGNVILYNKKMKESEFIKCPHCKSEMDYSDNPDFYYTDCHEIKREEEESKITEVVEMNYSSTSSFVNQNGLKEKAIELFGEDWENEDDCHQIESLLHYIGLNFYDVEFLENHNSEEDIKVSFNPLKEKLAEAINLLCNVPMNLENKEEYHKKIKEFLNKSLHHESNSRKQ